MPEKLYRNDNHILATSSHSKHSMHQYNVKYNVDY